jgi:hypothetical protein
MYRKSVIAGLTQKNPASAAVDFSKAIEEPEPELTTKSKLSNDVQLKRPTVLTNDSTTVEDIKE